MLYILNAYILFVHHTSTMLGKRNLKRYILLKTNKPKTQNIPFVKGTEIMTLQLQTHALHEQDLSQHHRGKLQSESHPGAIPLPSHSVISKSPPPSLR